MSKIIVHKSQKSKKRARKMLAKLKTFDEWVKNEQAVKGLERVFGLPAREAYEKFVSNVHDIAENGAVTNITVREKGA